MPITGAVAPSQSTTRQQSLGRAAARERFEDKASILGLDGKAKSIEPAIAVPSDVGLANWWMKITGATLIAPFIWDYTVEVYENALSITPLTGLEGAKARNGCETFNTAVLAGGHTIVPSSTACGVAIALKPIGTGLSVSVLDYLKVPGGTEFRFIFQVPNDAKYWGVP